MWRILATFCVAASAEFTLDNMGDLSKTLDNKADELKAKVTELSQKIAPLTAKIPQIPGNLTATVEERKAMLKEAMAEICKEVGSLTQVSSDIETSSADAKDKVAKVNAELAADPAKATGDDGPKFQYYLNNMQKAIMTYQSALSTANTYTVAMGQVCKVNDAAEAATRLYTEMNPMASSKFHLPSALLGAVAASVLGAAMVVFRTRKASQSQVSLMEEGTLE